MLRSKRLMSKSCGYQILDSSARVAVFTPAKKDHESVESWLLISIDLKLEKSKSKPGSPKH